MITTVVEQRPLDHWIAALMNSLAEFIRARRCRHEQGVVLWLAPRGVLLLASAGTACSSVTY